MPGIDSLVAIPGSVQSCDDAGWLILAAGRRWNPQPGRLRYGSAGAQYRSASCIS